MGIELPAELRDVAAKSGARWPEADEDAMRESAVAWRETATSLDSLARDADGTAQGALAAIDGDTALAARREWDGIVGGGQSRLPLSAKECTAAADRLDHAAEQIGAAKTQMVRQLVSLAKNTDAAEQAAASGDPQALAGVDTALRGASVGLAQVHDTLRTAVDIESGVTMESGSASAARSAGPGLLSAAGDTAGGVLGQAVGPNGPIDSTVDSAVGATSGVVGAATGTATEVAGPAAAGASGVVGSAAEGAYGAVGHAPDKVDRIGAALGNTAGGVSDVADAAVPAAAGAAADVAPGHIGELPGSGGWGGDAEHTGPISADIVGQAGAAGQSLTDAGTGAVPAAGSAAATPWPGGGAADPASITAPHAVHQAWAAPQAAAAAPGFAPGAAAPPGPQPPQAAPGGHFVAQPPPAAPGPVQGGQRPPVAPPPAAPVRPPAQPGPAPAAPGPPPGQVRQPPGGGQFVSGQPVQGQQPAARGTFRPGAPPPAQQPAPQQPAPQQPAPGQPDGTQRPLRQGDRKPAVVAFVLHQFPLGYMPVAASRASRQLAPPTEGDPAAGLRFPPQDHPQSELVSDADALARVQSGEARAAAAQGRRNPAPKCGEVSPEVVAAHDPLGELSESDWERSFHAGPATGPERIEYVWPSTEGFVEGGVEVGEPVVLDPDTVVDGFGDGAGRVLAAEGTQFSQRCLPPEYLERGYRRYRVMRQLPVWQAVTVPWFAQPGGGVRYRATYSVAELVAMGYLVELTKDRMAMEAHTVQIANVGMSPETPSGDMPEKDQEAQR